MRRLGRAHGITLVGGSVSERREGREKLSNTCVVCDPEGELAAVYRKIHLFDVEAGGFVYRESDAEEPGDEPVVAEIEGWPVGLTVCYDIRFPELYRCWRSRGHCCSRCPRTSRSTRARITGSCCCGPGRSRDQCFLAAAAQIGETLPGRQSFGRSSIVDPWGIVLAQAPDEETVIVADAQAARDPCRPHAAREPAGGRIPGGRHRPDARRLARPRTTLLAETAAA